MNVWIFGAGASKAYSASPTGQRMPVARDFFATYEAIKALTDSRWVLRGNLVTYLAREHGAPLERPFDHITDIEALHSEVEERLFSILKGKGRSSDYERPEDVERTSLYFKTYTELLFLFAAVINEIQDGPPSIVHEKIIKTLTTDDVLVTFNWDTLLDRALFNSTNWKPDFGYGFTPRNLMETSGWREPISNPDFTGPKLIKLHGSTNWLTSAITVENGKFVPTQQAPTNAVSVYLHSTGPYDTYDGRWLRPYEPFSYGYYPPNLDDPGKEAPKGYALYRANLRGPIFAKRGPAGDSGVVSMPLIIPPVKNKSYDYYGDLFRSLWRQAEEGLSQAECIFIIGYSFPKTDVQSTSLFLRAMMQRSTVPEIVVLNPEPDEILEKLIHEFGIPPSHIKCIGERLSTSFPLEKLVTNSSGTPASQ